MIDKNNKLPLYIQLKNYILENIKNKTFGVNSKLPTEKNLMEQFSLGRATVRAAISELEHEGYIIKRHGIGTFVADKTKKFGFEPLISLSYSLNSMGVNSVNIITKNDLITPNIELSEIARVEKKCQLGHICRIRHADGVPIAIENSYLDVEIYNMVKKFSLEASIADIILNKLDISIGKIDQTIILRELTPSEQVILKVPGSKSALELTRWLYTENNPTPFYFVSFVLLSDAMSYPFELFTKKQC